MRAAILTEYNQPMVVEEVTSLGLGRRDVRVQIEASGVCHSDVTIAAGGVPLPPPIILGHEGAGTVLEVGPDVTRVKAGDRVIASFIPACGNCWYCLHDQSNLCEHSNDLMLSTKATRSDGSTVFGMMGLGMFADEVSCEESMLVKIETDLPSEQLALIGCGVTTGVGAALNTARIQPGASVAVIGCGGVGQSVIQGARIAGASRIFAIDPVELKRKTAEQQGATDLIDPAQGDPIEQVKAGTGGRGADYAFEVIGLPETILQAYGAARRGGTVIIVGMPRIDATVTFPAISLFSDEKKMLGCMYGSAQVRRDFPRLVGLVETGRLDIGSMVSRRIKLDEVNDAFRAMQAGEVIRSVIV
ncbi:MAG TPA: Zn-dependent alcohol dehydrogenase [Acidimicrobiales bacterium]|jgi:S-(hydroxymethyl)glutathione dehydrogenase/alcohol dehydrogenase|nr:Zn-dependent alcohol dehydrogenase [Acidimicrobiales bacterium]